MLYHRLYHYKSAQSWNIWNYTAIYIYPGICIRSLHNILLFFGHCFLDYFRNISFEDIQRNFWPWPCLLESRVKPIYIYVTVSARFIIPHLPLPMTGWITLTCFVAVVHRNSTEELLFNAVTWIHLFKCFGFGVGRG